MDDLYSALDWLIVEMIGAQFGGVHPFEQLRREGMTRLVTGERPKAPDISELADWTFRMIDRDHFCDVTNMMRSILSARAANDGI